MPSKSLIERELVSRSAPALFDIKLYLFDKQLAFVEDASPVKTAVCSRRSGKTVACAADLIDTALKHAGVTCLYITLSRSNAKKIVWPELKKINRVHKLEGKIDNTELSITFPNGSVIYCSGAKDASEIEKFRGLAIKKVYIDECQSFRPYIQTLIDDVLGPALLDYAGTLCLIGTPGPIPTGYFHECAHNKAWAHYAWTFFDNPFVVQKSGLTHQQLLDRVLQQRGVSVAHPSIQREFFAKWETDLESLWITYNEELNHYDEAPVNLTHIMGIDLGYDDADAIGIIGWHESSPVTYLLEELITAGQGITELTEQVLKLQIKYNCAKMVIDQGGLGKKIAEEIRRQKHIPVQPADKARKMENVAFLNDALRTGRFKAKKSSRFAQDSYLVEKDKEKSTPDKIKLKDTYHSDIIDAVLYAFKESPAFAYQPPLEKPAPQTTEWYKQETSAMEQAAEEYFTKMEEASKGDDYI